MGACALLVCAPLAVALLTEGRGTDPITRIAVLLAFGLALAVAVALLLRAADARTAWGTAASELALRQARDQQAATAEILGAMAATPPDLQRVLDTIARNATRVCDSLYAVVFRSDGTEIRLAAHHGLSPSRLAALNERYPIAVNDGSLLARAIRTASVLHFPDLLDDPDIPTWLRDLARAEGYRSLVVVPMVQDGRAVGSLNVSRAESGFTKRQIQVLQTFAAQAVIAIENVRLFTELQTRNRELTEALEQQTATAEILGAISRSPTETQPVFDGIVASAVSLCSARIGAIYRIDDDSIDVVATVDHNPEARREHATAYPMPVSDLQPPFRRVISTAAPGHIVDVEAEPEFSDAFRERARVLGYRSGAIVPMRREGRVIGLISVGRIGHGGAPKPFSDREIGLLQVFAEQAVIAIENVRLFRELAARNHELTESLERQTATGGILRAIAMSPTDSAPVFEAILDSALRLCRGTIGAVLLSDGRLVSVAAHKGRTGMTAAVRSMYPRGIDDRGLAVRAIREGVSVHIADVREEPSSLHEVDDAGEIRAELDVPMVREGRCIGAITVCRPDPGLFSEAQVALVHTLADQAAIAVENVRLFTELEARNRELTESLEQQTATAEILRAISSSPANVQPVFDSILERAIRLADGVFGSAFSFDGERVHLIAHRGLSEEALALTRHVYPMVPGPEQISARVVLERRVVHVRDVDMDPNVSATTREFAKLIGFRSLLAVPMLREDRAVGVLTITRATGEFSPRHIELVKTFADQAVIAIENVRLFTELQARNVELTESLEQQTAMAEILRVISSSPADLRPVMDVVAERAARLCGADNVVAYRLEGQILRAMAVHGPWLTEEIQLSRGVPSGRAVLDRATVHVPDVRAAGDEYPEAPARATRTNTRAILAAPLLREGEAVGTITMRRDTPGPFTDRQVKLLETFAAQAVIAIENVRLFQELEARNRELTESLEQQMATGEILRAISASPTDTQPVFETIAQRAVRVCDGTYCTVFRFDGVLIDAAAHHGMSAESLEELRRVYPMPLATADTLAARSIRAGAVAHVADIVTDPSEPVRRLAQVGHYRTVVVVPMLRGGKAVGAIAVARSDHAGEPRPFTEKEIALLQTFADQGVIAVENVRLFRELEARNHELTESLEQQTATSEILRAISASPTDIQPVFDTIAQRAVRVCDGTHCVVFRLDGSLVDAIAHSGLSTESVGEVRRIYPLPLSADTLAVRSIREGKIIHNADMLDDPSEPVRRQALVGGYRSGILVPLLRSGIAVGVIAVGRSDPAGGPRPFTEKEIALLQTFADQGVIAVENVRLFQELEARNRELTESLEQQTATAEILRVISSSPTDVHPVFDTIAANAARVCQAGNANVYRFDGSLIHLVASDGYTAEELSAVKGIFPMPPGRGGATARAVSTGAVSHIPDMSTDPDLAYPALVQAGFRTSLSVPMVRDGQSIGAITVARRETRPFSDRQIALLQTFAAQAVIAVENVRLFTELGARNRELTESLEQQTATAGILQVISGSPTDIQPIFESIARSATTLCEADLSGVHTFDGELIHIGALYGRTPEETRAIERAFPQPPSRLSVTARAILTAAAVQIPDHSADPEVADSLRSYRTVLAVPMIGDGKPIGAISVARRIVKPFSDRQIALLRTFADQGVIAIKNVRLFRELQARTRELAQSVEELQALGEVGRAVSSTLDLPTVLATIVARAVQLSGTSGGVVYEYDEAGQEFALRASHRIEEELVEVLQSRPVRLGEGATGQAALRRAPVEVPDTVADLELQIGQPARTTLNRLGYRSILGIPLLLEREILGALTVFRREPGSFPPETMNLLQSFATQSTIAIHNARLFREIEAKGRELEVASRHKSQFLANMSHELRTPLNAILGYTELLIDGIYGELTPKAGDVMARIDRSGKHLLGLINDVLDLSKIEAGQLELALADYSLAEVVHAVVTQVESLAAEKGLILQATVAPDLPAGRGDERRLAQVLLNLVGNAIKFTEVGSVRIVAHRDGDAFVVSVADTGPGIAEADRQRIFEEFQQADSSSTRKKGGTGLGLSIAKRIVELHGGRIWVESTVERGSVFSFRVPARVERQVARA